MTLTPPRIRRQPPLADQVYDILRESIIMGELRPGERIVFERLAPKLGVSQTPVREAAIRLAEDGLAAEGLDGKLYVVSLTEEYAADIFLVRSALEGLAAELAATRLADADLVELRVLLQNGSSRLSEGDGAAYGREIDLFHRRIQDAAGNPVLTRELRSLFAHVDFIFRYTRRQVGAHHRHAQAEHWQIFEVLSRRDPAAARLAMEHHIRRAGARAVEAIKQLQGKHPITPTDGAAQPGPGDGTPRRPDQTANL